MDCFADYGEFFFVCEEGEGVDVAVSYVAARASASLGDSGIHREMRQGSRNHDVPKMTSCDTPLLEIFRRLSNQSR